MALGKNLKKNSIFPSKLSTKESAKPPEEKQSELRKQKDVLIDTLVVPHVENKTQKIDTTTKEKEISKELLVVFEVGAAFYALPIGKIKEVVKISHITSIPQAPESILGVTNIRGEVYALTDLQIRLGHQNQKNQTPNLAMVIEDKIFKIAVAIHKVPETYRIDKNNIENPSAFLPSSMNDQELIYGVISIGEKKIMVLAAEKLLEEENTITENLLG